MMWEDTLNIYFIWNKARVGNQNNNNNNFPNNYISLKNIINWITNFEGRDEYHKLVHISFINFPKTYAC